MTKATVYYVDFTEQERAILNANGWSCGIGRDYMAAKAGNITADNIDLFRRAAVVEISENGGCDRIVQAEQVYCMLQNHSTAWADNCNKIECLTNFPRSMDVGDVIVWDDTGEAWRVDSTGFGRVPNFAKMLPAAPNPNYKPDADWGDDPMGAWHGRNE